MKNFRSKTMHKLAITLAGALERTEDMRWNISFGFDSDTSIRNITVELGRFSRLTEICIKQMPTRPKDTLHGFEKCILARITMRGFNIDDGIKMARGEIQRLGIANAKGNSEGAVCLTVVLDGFGILIHRGICFRLVIAFHERGATSMPTTDFQNILASEIPSACHMMIQLDGRSVSFIPRLKFQRFPFWRPVAIVEDRDRVTPDAPAEILIPDFPEYLFEGGHKVFHFSDLEGFPHLHPNVTDCPKYNLSSVLILFHCG